MKLLQRTTRFMAAAAFGVLSSGLMPVVTAHAYSTDPVATDNKVWVCKYVRTPGSAEQLKSGNDGLVSVSVNAIPEKTTQDPVKLGDSFADKQGRSVVIAWDNDNGKTPPPVSMCPTPDPTILVTATPGTFSDPCGPAVNITFTSPKVTGVRYTTWFTGEQKEILNVAATAEEGYVLSNPEFTQAMSDTLTPCATVKQCTPNGSEVVSYDEDFADYQDTRSKGHYEFLENGLRMWTEDVSSQSKVAWYHEVSYPLTDIGVPSMDYAATSGIKPGMQIVVDTNGNNAADPADAVLVGEPDAYGAGKWWSNYNFGIGSGMGYPSFGTLNDYLAKNPNLHVVAVGFALGSGVKADGVLKSLTFGCYTWYFKKAPRQPAACTVTNQHYTGPWDFDEYKYPEVGAYPDEEGTPGSYTFKTDGLYLSSPNEESYVDGLIDAGETRLLDIDAMSYKTYRSASSTGESFQAPSYILYVDKDGNPETDDTGYLIFEPLYSYGNDAIQVGQWQTWDVLKGGTSKWWGLGDNNPSRTWNDILAQYPNAVALAYGFNQGTSNPGIDSAVQDIVFDCATTHFTTPQPTNGGGQVLGETTTTPSVTTPKVLTVTAAATTASTHELEDTGNSFALPLAMSTGIMGLALSALLQDKRRQYGLAARLRRLASQLRTLLDQPFVVPTA